MGNDLWVATQEALRRCVAEQTFQTWFKPISFLAKNDSTITLKVPSQFFYEWVKSHYGELVEETISGIAGLPLKVDYSIVLEEQKETYPRSLFESPQKQVQNKPKQDFSPNLNDQYIFSNFVEGPSNQFAKAAGQAVVEAQDNSLYNPLVVYGGVGLGKTHLVQAIGNALLDLHPEKRVMYVTSEKFTLDYINAIKENRTAQFSKFYRSVDLLIVDDIQFFQKKIRTQEEFFHTFNELYMSGRRIILSTDRPPAELGLHSRLTSRFNAGLLVDIQEPDYETRVAILRQKADESGSDIPYEVLEFLAVNIDTNVRDLQGALIRLLAYASLVKSDITPNLARRVLAEVMHQQVSTVVNVDSIVEAVAENFGIKKVEIMGKSRRQEIALARQIAMFMAKQLTRNSLKSIGLSFGGRDHSTVIHAVKTIGEKMNRDELFNAEVKTLIRRLSEPVFDQNN